MAGYINNYRKQYGFDSETAIRDDISDILDAVKKYKNEIGKYANYIQKINKEDGRYFEEERYSLFEETFTLPEINGGLKYSSPHIVDYDEGIYYLIDFNQQKVIDSSRRSEELFEKHNDKLIVNTGSYIFLPILENKEKGYIVATEITGLRKGKFGYKLAESDYEQRTSAFIYDHFNGTTTKVVEWKDEVVIRPNYEHISQVGIHHSEFLEEIYGLQKSTLNNKISLDDYFKLLKYSGNTYQAFLQTKQFSSWFLDNVIKTLRPGGKPMKEKSIQGWLGLNLPDMKHLLTQPNQNMLIHFLLTNKNKETSLVEFLKTEDKIIELNQKWLKEFDKRDKSTNKYVSSYDHIILTRRNKYIMSTNTLPEFMKFYHDQRIYKDHSLYRYLKYIIDEGKRSFNKETKTYLSLKNIEDYLSDYNRMLKQINPQAKYVMPYNIKKAHDSMVENHLQIMDERRQIKNGDQSYFLNFMSVYKDSFYQAYQTNDYIIVHPNKSYDLHEEGSSLNHCVASYADKVLSGKSMIFFMRRRNEPERPLITIEIYKDSTRDLYYLNQARGKGNRLPNIDEKQFIDQWLLKYNEQYKEDKKQKQKENELKRLQAKEFNPDFVHTLKLFGYKDIYYDDELDKNTNYIEVARKGIAYIIEKQKAEDIYDPQSIDGLLENIEKVFKREKVKISTVDSLLENDQTTIQIEANVPQQWDQER